MVQSRPSPSLIHKRCVDLLARSLPESWNISLNATDSLTIRSESGEESSFTLVVCRSATPRAIRESVDRCMATNDLPPRSMLIIADYLSIRSQELLQEYSANWIDTVGNICVRSTRPGLYVDRRGETKNPWAESSPLQTLRGAGTEKVMRALLSTQPPFGVRELALRSECSPATTSRVIDLLERESFLERTPSGGVATLEWRGALRRWAEEARTVREVVSLSCSEPRGLEYFQRELRQTTLHYAATGSLAAHQLAPAAPLRTAALYVSNPSDLQDALGLREVESGANVLLIESASLPSSSDVSQRNGMFIAPVAQVAVDLLSGTGREPGEGEVLLQWMEDHLNEWRR